MIIKLKKNEFDYLNYPLLEGNQALHSKLRFSVNKGSFLVDVSTDTADEIREWAMDELQRIGFDVNYNLTYEGRILEDMIDVFYQV